MRLGFIFLFFIVLNFTNIYSQDTTAIKKCAYKKLIIPATLISIGAVMSGSLFEKEFKSTVIDFVGEGYHCGVDDYLLFSPIIVMYSSDILKVKSKNNWFDQTKYLVIANIFSFTITHTLKHIVNKTRPNGDSFSMPSGHTTSAFTNATVLYEEFRESYPMIAYSGYLLSSVTGSFRIINNKHWLSDVLVGAGIGILTTRLVYCIEPLKKFNPFSRKSGNSFSLIPYFDDNSARVLLTYTF